MDLQIFTNDDRTEFAAMRVGDMSMRARTMLGVHYPVLVGEYEITTTSDLAVIDTRSRVELELHVVPNDNGETVLYAGDIEIGTLSVVHNDCEEVE